MGKARLSRFFPAYSSPNLALSKKEMVANCSYPNLLFLSFFYVRRELTEQAFQTQPAPARQVLVLPDTIKVNGDSLSFRGRMDGRLYQLYYKLASPREKKSFQKLADLVTLEIEAEFNLAEGRRKFFWF